jgi:hypothetical protein
VILEPTPARDGVTLLGVRLPEVCTIKRLEWGECPGCGLTRSFVLGVRLDPEAFRLHPAGPLLLLVVVAQLPYRVYRLRRRRRLVESGLVDLGWSRSRRLARAALWGLPAAVLAGWLAKVAWF